MASPPLPPPPPAGKWPAAHNPEPLRRSPVRGNTKSRLQSVILKNMKRQRAERADRRLQEERQAMSASRAAAALTGGASTRVVGRAGGPKSPPRGSPSRTAGNKIQSPDPEERPVEAVRVRPPVMAETRQRGSSGGEVAMLRQDKEELQLAVRKVLEDLAVADEDRNVARESAERAMQNWASERSFLLNKLALLSEHELVRRNHQLFKLLDRKTAECSHWQEQVQRAFAMHSGLINALDGKDEELLATYGLREELRSSREMSEAQQAEIDELDAKRATQASANATLQSQLQNEQQRARDLAAQLAEARHDIATERLCHRDTRAEKDALRRRLRRLGVKVGRFNGAGLDDADEADEADDEAGIESGSGRAGGAADLEEREALRAKVRELQSVLVRMRTVPAVVAPVMTSALAGGAREGGADSQSAAQLSQDLQQAKVQLAEAADEAERLRFQVQSLTDACDAARRRELQVLAQLHEESQRAEERMWQVLREEQGASAGDGDGDGDAAAAGDGDGGALSRTRARVAHELLRAQAAELRREQESSGAIRQSVAAVEAANMRLESEVGDLLAERRRQDERISLLVHEVERLQASLSGLGGRETWSLAARVATATHSTSPSSSSSSSSSGPAAAAAAAAASTTTRASADEKKASGAVGDGTIPATPPRAEDGQESAAVLLAQESPARAVATSPTRSTTPRRSRGRVGRGQSRVRGRGENKDNALRGEVVVTFTEGFLGFTLLSTGRPLAPAVISRFPRMPDGRIGPAERSGLLGVGDEISRIDGVYVQGMSYDQVVACLRTSGRPLRIHWRRAFHPPSFELGERMALGPHHGVGKSGSVSVTTPTATAGPRPFFATPDELRAVNGKYTEWEPCRLPPWGHPHDVDDPVIEAVIQGWAADPEQRDSLRHWLRSLVHAAEKAHGHAGASPAAREQMGSLGLDVSRGSKRNSQDAGGAGTGATNTPATGAVASVVVGAGSSLGVPFPPNLQRGLVLERLSPGIRDGILMLLGPLLARLPGVDVTCFRRIKIETWSDIRLRVEHQQQHYPTAAMMSTDDGGAQRLTEGTPVRPLMTLPPTPHESPIKHALMSEDDDDDEEDDSGDAVEWLPPQRIRTAGGGEVGHGGSTDGGDDVVGGVVGLAGDGEGPSAVVNLGWPYDG